MCLVWRKIFSIQGTFFPRDVLSKNIDQPSIANTAKKFFFFSIFHVWLVEVLENFLQETNSSKMRKVTSMMEVAYHTYCTLPPSNRPHPHSPSSPAPLPQPPLVFSYIIYQMLLDNIFLHIYQMQENKYKTSRIFYGKHPLPTKHTILWTKWAILLLLQH